jgi:F420-0:gamma-glutamyl ligase
MHQYAGILLVYLPNTPDSNLDCVSVKLTAIFRVSVAVVQTDKHFLLLSYSTLTTLATCQSHFTLLSPVK